MYMKEYKLQGAYFKDIVAIENLFFGLVSWKFCKIIRVILQIYESMMHSSGVTFLQWLNWIQRLTIYKATNAKGQGCDKMI